ncbi:MAG: hypothetical protein Fur0028_03680 [Bacteroidales bacterium]
MTNQCKQCGGQVDYIPGSLLLKCTHCSSEEKIEVKLDSIPLHHFDDNEVTKSSINILKCPTCGAEFRQSNIAIDQCPYCTTIVVNESIINKTEVGFDGIIPFKISKYDAIEKIKKWRKKRCLSPNDFKKYIYQLDFLKGIYVPYWLIYTKTHVNYKGKCGQESLTSKKTRWTGENGELTTRLENLALLGTTSIPKQIMDKTMPDFGEVVAEPWDNRWDFNQLLPFNDSFCFGFSSEMPQIEAIKVINNNESKIKYELEQKVIQKIEKSGCDMGMVNNLSYKHLELDYRLVLLPVWISAFKFKNRVYQILVNGQSGEVIGERPVSRFKVAIMWILIFILIIYIGFIIALQNYWLWGLHLALIIIAIYLKQLKKDN